MTTTHTPGPWSYRVEAHDFGIGLINNRGADIVLMDGMPSPADAALIAAAPDLLEALRAVWDFWCGGDAPKELEDQIVSAITKAEGR